MESLREAFRKALSNIRSSFTIFSPKGDASSIDGEEEVKGPGYQSIKEVYYMFSYLTKKMNLDSELIYDLGYNKDDARLIIDSRRFQISVEARHSDFSRIKIKFKELIATILIRTL